MRIDRAQILVLNYNGRGLLAECLPSLVAAAASAPVPCGVSIVDNASTDDSLAYLASAWPRIEVIREPNRGLASFNHVLAHRDEPALLLLNNDVKLREDAVGPLLTALDQHDDALFTAPLCWDFDGTTYEGMRTRVRTRFGLIQGMSRVPDIEALWHQPDLTAAAGPVLAVDRRKFLELGGFDPIYFPGRIEDLDLGFRAWMNGWRGYYVPESVAFHRGFGAFGPAFGANGCDRLAARNSFLFAWKNLRGGRLFKHLAWIPIRLAYDLARLRGIQSGAFVEALSRIPKIRVEWRRSGLSRSEWRKRQEAFFQRFAW